MNVDETERPDFGARFKELTGHTPFGWQRRAVRRAFYVVPPFERLLERCENVEITPSVYSCNPNGDFVQQ